MPSTPPEEEVSAFLLDLAKRRYDPEIAIMDKIFTVAGTFDPAVLVAKVAIDDWLALNKLTAPAKAVPDGRGGMVPLTRTARCARTIRQEAAGKWDVRGRLGRVIL